MTIRIKDYESPFGTITISSKKSTGALVYTQAGCCQSEADGNGVSVVSYIHAIFGLIAQFKTRTALLIGCGGGTLGTMLARAGCSVTIVDVDPTAFTIARQHFELPDSIERQVADGKDFLLSRNFCYDTIVLDAFVGDHIPAHLRSRMFYKLMRSRLAPHGAVFANIYVRNAIDHIHERVAGEMANVWPAMCDCSTARAGTTAMPS